MLKNNSELNELVASILQLASETKDGIVLVIPIRDGVLIQNGTKTRPVDTSIAEGADTYEKAINKLLDESLMTDVSNGKRTSLRITSDGVQVLSELAKQTGGKKCV